MRKARRDSGVEPGRQQARGGACEEGALKFLGGVFAGLRAAFGTVDGTKRDCASEGIPFAATRPLEEATSVAKGGLGRRLDFRRLERAPDFLEARCECGLHFPDGVGAPRKNRGARRPC